MCISKDFYDCLIEFREQFSIFSLSFHYFNHCDGTHIRSDSKKIWLLRSSTYQVWQISSLVTKYFHEMPLVLIILKPDKQIQTDEKHIFMHIQKLNNMYTWFWVNNLIQIIVICSILISILNLISIGSLLKL